MKTLALLSGGLDSTVLVAHLLDEGDEVAAVSFDYGQRHAVELACAARVAAHYNLRYDLVDLGGLGKLLTGSALTDPSVDVPHGHYQAESMRATVVPNRNAIMTMAAVGIAVARGYDRVALAVHAGDHEVYPDCRPAFILGADMLARVATDGFGEIRVIAPFVRWAKSGIVQRGVELNAPLTLTWSCYEGDKFEGFGTGPRHCGRCGTCVERHEAFVESGLLDPTIYYPHPAGSEACTAASSIGQACS